MSSFDFIVCALRGIHMHATYSFRNDDFITYCQYQAKKSAYHLDTAYEPKAYAEVVFHPSIHFYPLN